MLIEMMIAAGIFLLLTAVLFMIFFMGAKAWRKTDQRADVTREAQLATARLIREATRSSFLSLSITPDGRAVSFLSPMDDNGQFVFDAAGNTRWQRFVIYYCDLTAGELRRLEVPLPVGSTLGQFPEPIERLNPPKTLSGYLTGGRVIARDLVEFGAWTPMGSRRLNLTVTVKKSVPREPDATATVTTGALFHN
ncbi:MAG: hypothetical protein KC910_34065 [Candidatus Eremiobacteraeota bacterium]|nr:hypothetical protein [Candidatus Eremiobacteraeota bacterium]